MGRAVTLRADFDGPELRILAKSSKDAGQSRHCHVKRSDFDRLFSGACRDANHLLHTPSIST